MVSERAKLACAAGVHGQVCSSGAGIHVGAQFANDISPNALGNS